MSSSHTIYAGVLTDIELTHLYSDFTGVLKKWLRDWNTSENFKVDVLARNKTLFQVEHSCSNAVNNGLISYDNNLSDICLNLVKSELKINNDIELNNGDSVFFEALTKNCCHAFEQTLFNFSTQFIGKGDIENFKVEREFNSVLSLKLCIGGISIIVCFSDIFIAHFVGSFRKEPQYHPFTPITLDYVFSELHSENVDCLLNFKTIPIPINRLFSLHVGQVLKLEQHLKRSIPLNINNKDVAFSGYLVKTDGEKAVYLSGD